jgi:hypothetical protein
VATDSYPDGLKSNLKSQKYYDNTGVFTEKEVKIFRCSAVTGKRISSPAIL